MINRRVVRFRCLAPLAHGAFGESAGNVTLIRRLFLSDTLSDDARVPCVSGNALRGVARRLIMRELFDAAGLSRAMLPPAQWDRLYAALANGGHLEGAGEISVDPDAVRALRAALPPLSLFGAALYSWMLPGHLSAGILWPRCIETAALGLVAPAGEDEALLSAEDLVEEIGHVRHVDREHQDPEISGVTPMPTTLEVLTTGTVLESDIRFAPHATEIERGAWDHAMDLVAFLGGKSAAGLGRVERISCAERAYCRPLPHEEGENEAGEYLAWLRGGNHGAILTALSLQLARKPVKPRRGKAEEAGKGEEAEA